MKKNLTSLVSAIRPLEVVGSIDKEITALECDSRKANAGTLFVAIPGVTVDAHKFIPEVVKAGASAIVCERLPEELADGVTYIRVESSARRPAF